MYQCYSVHHIPQQITNAYIKVLTSSFNIDPSGNTDLWPTASSVVLQTLATWRCMAEFPVRLLSYFITTLHFLHWTYPTASFKSALITKQKYLHTVDFPSFCIILNSQMRVSF